MVHKSADIPNQEADPRRKVVRPPAPYFGFSKSRFFLNEVLFNPRRARKEVLHFMLPFIFEDPKDVRRRKRLQRIAKLAIKNTVPKEVTPKQPEIVEKKEKAYRYKFRWRNQKKLAEGGYGILYKAEVSIPNPEGKTPIYETCAVKYLMINDGDNFLWNRKNALYKISLTKAEAWIELYHLKNLQGPGSDFIVRYISHGYIRGTLLIALEFCKYGDLSRFFEVCKSKWPRRNPYYDYGGPKVVQPGETERNVGFVTAFPIRTARIIMAAVCEALRFMHSKGFIHRDVKVFNVLINNQGFPKLCDFGTSVYIGQEEMAPIDRDGIGSSFYMAPETVCKQPFNASLDTWQVGIMMMLMIYGYMPYAFKHPEIVAWSKEDVKARYRDDSRVIYVLEYFRSRNFDDYEVMKLLSLDISDLEGEERKEWSHFKNFIKVCFRRDVKSRPKAAQICQHPYLSEAVAAWKECIEKQIPPTQMFEELEEMTSCADRLSGSKSQQQEQQLLEDKYDDVFAGEL